MKHVIVLSVLAAALLAASCATVRQNIDARTYLAKCRYEYAGLKVRGVRFSSGILIDSVDLDVAVKITNTTDRDVALDHVEMSLSLDGSRVLDAAHRNFTRIVPGAASVETAALGVPFDGVMKSLGRRLQKMEIAARLWVTLLLGKDTWETPIVIPLSVEVPIPWEQIDSFVAQKKKQLEEEAAANARKAAEDVLKNSVPSITAPSF